MFFVFVFGLFSDVFWVWVVSCFQTFFGFVFGLNVFFVGVTGAVLFSEVSCRGLFCECFRIFFLSDGVPVFSDITVFSGVQVCPGDIVSFGFILNCPASGSASSRSISVVGKQSKLPRRRTDGPVVPKRNQIDAQLFLEKCYKFGSGQPPPPL